MIDVLKWTTHSQMWNYNVVLCEVYPTNVENQTRSNQSLNKIIDFIKKMSCIDKSFWLIDFFDTTIDFIVAA